MKSNSQAKAMASIRSNSKSTLVDSTGTSSQLGYVATAAKSKTASTKLLSILKGDTAEAQLAEVEGSSNE